MDKEIDLILEFESECMEIAQPIINRLCKRSMRTMNKKTANYFDCEDYPSTFSFIDILSIKDITVNNMYWYTTELMDQHGAATTLMMIGLFLE